MSTPYFILQLRSGSSRLPGKMTMPFCKGKIIPEIIIERLIESGIQPQNIIVATTTNPKDDLLVETLQHNGYLIYRGSEENVLQRFIEAAIYYGAKEIVRICSDNPFLNIGFIRKMINMDNLSKYDYVSYYLNKKTPAIKTHFGLFCEYTNLSILETIAENSINIIDLEHVTPYIYNNPDKFKIKKIDIPKELVQNQWLRLTIDTIEDFNIAQHIYNKATDVNDYNQLIRLATSEGFKPLMKTSIIRNTK